MKIIAFALTLLLISCDGSVSKKAIVAPNSTTIVEPSTMLPIVENCGYRTSSDFFDGWQLIFEENFDKDLSQWISWESGAFNQELQHYQKDQIFLNDDLLYIKSQRKSVSGKTNPSNSTLKDFEFISGRLESIETFGPEATQGKETVRLSARLRLVEGHGLWPAWWSYNDPWPTQGEMDILEARGDTPMEFQSNFHYGAKINEIETDPTFNDLRYTHSEKLSDCFHLYELIWSKNKFEILFDGHIVNTYNADTYNFVSSFFNKKHRLALNLAIGGWFFDELSINDIPDEAYYVIDWVKVHEK